MSLYGDLIPELSDDTHGNESYTGEDCQSRNVEAISSNLPVQSTDLKSSSITASSSRSAVLPASVLKFQPIRRKTSVAPKSVVKAGTTTKSTSEDKKDGDICQTDDIDKDLDAFTKDIENAATNDNSNSTSVVSLNPLKMPTFEQAPVKYETPRVVRGEDDSNVDMEISQQVVSSSTVNFKKRKALKKTSNQRKNEKDPEAYFSSEYDPMDPNDFEECNRLFKILKARENDASEYSNDDIEPEDLEWKNRQSRFGPPRKPVQEESQESQESPKTHDPPSALVDITLSGEAAYARRLAMTSKSQEISMDEKGKLQNPDFAKSLMSKYGWSEGQGLGRDGVGIINPLQVKVAEGKISRIVNKNQKQKEDLESLGAISKVIVITNMTSPHEFLKNMDREELQQETGDECSKYGEIERCTVVAVPVPLDRRIGAEGLEDDGLIHTPETELIRIFVVFSNEGAATRAVQDLRGRYFGGRKIWARFWDMKKFTQGQVT